MERVQTFQGMEDWHSGAQLIKAEITDKVEAHERGLLHLSAHLIIVDGEGRVLSRLRGVNESRYPGVWTSTIGTHVLVDENYLSTIQPLLPVEKPLQFVGEFRVQDAFENEVNGLLVLNAEEQELPVEFLSDRRFFEIAELEKLIEEQKTTPHLAGCFEVLQSIPKT